jgi:hypothetical protein
MIFFVCLRWVDECHTIRGARVVLAPITGVQSGLARQQLIYEFADENGNRYGGYSHFFGEVSENAVIVFYRPGDPDQNRAHRSFHFHDVQICAITALKTPLESITREPVS